MQGVELADLFAGGGGFSTGVASACKQLHRTPSLIAINHWNIAVETHRRNHPWARHLCTGLHEVNPSDVAPYRLNLLTASPECIHHSNARGGKPMNDQSRSSAWLILKWLQELYVEAVLIENVQEFENWGPLGADQRPLKSMSGALFDQFISSLKALGYNVEWRVLNAANYGGATTRERLFVMARRGRNKRIIWPDESHARSGDVQGDLFASKQKWRPAREIIDWSTPSQSIFTRKKPLAPATLERIAAGLKKFGGKNAEPFLVILRNHMAGQSIHTPLPTLTAGGQHVGLCEPFFFNMNHGQDQPLSANRPMPTITATSNDYGLVQPFIAELRGGKFANDINEPLSTISTSGGHHALIQSFVIGQQSCAAPRGINDPLPTIASAGAISLIQPFILNAAHGDEGPGSRARRSTSMDAPMPTITAGGIQHGLIEPMIVSYYGTQNVSGVSQPLPTVTTKDRFGLVEFDGMLLDIHFRMLQWRELANAMGFPEDYDFAGNRSEKVKQVGNAVEVRTAEALAMAALAV